MGRPKALLRHESTGTSFVEQAVQTLIDGGCDDVTVVVGAAEAEVRILLTGRPVEIVACPTWQLGMGESLRAGLTALDERSEPAGSDAALIHLVDLPDVGAEVVRRLLHPAPADGWAQVLRRAAYAPDGEGKGHPVLIGRAHWAGVREVAVGDRGARDYLRAHPPELVDMTDLALGRDVDRPSDL